MPQRTRSPRVLRRNARARRLIDRLDLVVAEKPIRNGEFIAHRKDLHCVLAKLAADGLDDAGARRFGGPVAANWRDVKGEAGAIGTLGPAERVTKTPDRATPAGQSEKDQNRGDGRQCRVEVRGKIGVEESL